MKIAFACQDCKGWESIISPHFGKCAFFVIVRKTEEGFQIIEEIPNPYQNSAPLPGALPAFLKEKGVNLVVAGGMGKKAQDFFNEWGIKFLVGVKGKIKEILPYLEENRKED
ncbi:MAG TPA: dinitrogenase iron-molybdenum cofactor [bacterium]|nr:dinitrogenase iron-molybdenum cofactor [bacterium]HEX68130.1 dinitrogenase iron-molybdenum cofactor [bacterium]